MVAANTVHYLRTGDKKSLDQAILLGQKFEDKLTYTDFAFWYYYPRTLADVQAKDAGSIEVRCLWLAQQRHPGRGPAPARQGGARRAEATPVRLEPGRCGTHPGDHGGENGGSRNARLRRLAPRQPQRSTDRRCTGTGTCTPSDRREEVPGGARIRQLPAELCGGHA